MASLIKSAVYIISAYCFSLSKTTKLILLDSLLQEVCISSDEDGSLALSSLGLSVCLSQSQTCFFRDKEIPLNNLDMINKLESCLLCLPPSPPLPLDKIFSVVLAPLQRNFRQISTSSKVMLFVFELRIWKPGISPFLSVGVNLKVHGLANRCLAH